MADDTDNSVSGLLAPWMAQDPFDMSQYGGAGQFGASMLAAAGPTPYKQPFMVGLGKGMLAAQNSALDNAKSRMALGMNALSLQQRMAMFPMLMSMLHRMQPGGGVAAPSGAPSAPGSQPAPDASTAAPAPSGAPTAPSGGDQSAPPAAPWMSGGGDIAPLDESRIGAIMGAVGMPNEFGKDAALRLQYSPGAATAMEFAKSPIAQDMMLLNRAAAAQDPQFGRMAMTKLQTDMGTQHIGSMSGIRTYQEPDGSWTTVNPSNGLKVNDRSGASYMPGALAAFGQREAVEQGARTRAELGAETSPAGGGGTGGGQVPVPANAPTGAPPAVRALPAQQPAAPMVAGHAAVTTPNYIPPLLSQAGSVPQRPGSTSLVALKAGQESQAHEAVKDVDDLTQQANQGKILIAQSEQILGAAQNFRPQRFADAKGQFLEVLNAANLLTPEETKQLGSYQDAKKIAIQLQASATKQLGSREAAQVFKTMGNSIPNLTMSADGLQKVSAYMQGVARYNMAMSVFSQRLLNQGNTVAADSVENSFVAHSDPSYYIFASAPQSVQREFLAEMPAAKRTAFVTSWNEAARNGMAPKPGDYLGQ